MTAERAYRLPERPALAGDFLRRVAEDAERFAREGLPAGLEEYLRDRHGVDVAGDYGGLPLKNPWGVASGQLSMKLNQVEGACEAGLGFVVLKTVIAEDESGGRSMGEWAVKESRMVVEPIVGERNPVAGWTVTWKGRGWWHSFEDYLTLVGQAADVGKRHGVPVVPSVKYHLPASESEAWRTGEYESTTRRVLDAYRAGQGGEGTPQPMPIEKDFSPTLAGSERSTRRRMILEWLERVPGLIRDAAAPGDLSVGLKLFNSLEGDDFQREMLALIHREKRPDFYIYANRLFDPEKVFDGHKGVAYGGPDLSERNLRLLSALRRDQAAGAVPAAPLAMSATGDVHSGRIAVEYALRGASSFQMHTLFQLPPDEFPMKRGERAERALHRLYFDPAEGFVVWLRHAGERLGLVKEGLVRLRDVAGAGQASEIQAGDLDA